MSPDLSQHVVSQAARLLALLVDPYVQFLFYGSLFWWPYLLSALAVALFGFWLGHGEGWRTLGEFRRRFLSRRIWAHPSAQADYAYYIVNAILHPVIVVPLVVTGGAVALWVEDGLALLFGPAPAPLLGVTAARVLYTVLFFIAYDFARFLAHAILHDLPFLWQFHKLHHSAEVLTPITNYRAHPVELFIMAAVPNLATGLVSGVVWYLAAGEIGFYAFLGAHVLMRRIQHLRQSAPFRMSGSRSGPRLNAWLISPAHHQIHHSRIRAISAESRLRAGGLGPACRYALRAGCGGGAAARPRRRHATAPGTASGGCMAGRAAMRWRCAARPGAGAAGPGRRDGPRRGG